MYSTIYYDSLGLERLIRLIKAMLMIVLAAGGGGSDVCVPKETLSLMALKGKCPCH